MIVEVISILTIVASIFCWHIAKNLSAEFQKLFLVLSLGLVLIFISVTLDYILPYKMEVLQHILWWVSLLMININGVISLKRLSKEYNFMINPLHEKIITKFFEK